MQHQTTLAPRLTRRASLGLAVVGLFAAAAHAADESSGFAAVDAAAAKLIDDHSAPGLSLSVLKAGKFVYSKGFGWANLETGTPVTPRSIFKIGSISKQFTATALMQMQEEGELSVDDKLAKFYPDFPKASEISLRQMLTHTSGLGNYTDTRPREKFYQDSRRDYDADALYAAMRATDPLYVFEPGADWAYSNTAFVLLGLIVQKVAAEPYGSYFKRRLFDPAGLNDTAVDEMAQVVSSRASGYSAHAGSDTDFDNASFISMTYPGGAGAIRSTSQDLCRWHEAVRWPHRQRRQPEADDHAWAVERRKPTHSGPGTRAQEADQLRVRPIHRHGRRATLHPARRRHPGLPVRFAHLPGSTALGGGDDQYRWRPAALAGGSGGAEDRCDQRGAQPSLKIGGARRDK
ncbi:MAG: serine hydrolase domain-containing protein [Caulobacteraceae bacterium]